MEYPKKKAILIITIILLVGVLGVITYLDKALLMGLSLIVFLTGITFFILYKSGIKSKTLYLLFLLTLLIHLSVVLFFHYTQFQPLGSGDFVLYQQIAEEVAQRINQGIYSLEGLNFPHYYPVLIGIIYAFTLPKIIIGELFGVWLIALSVLFVFLIVQEIEKNEKWAFIIGLIVSIYPSYLYFGSLLLKDTIIIPLVLSGMLLFIKMMKNFTVLKFLSFFIILTALIHLRFYIGYSVLFSFIICWFIISSFKIKKRLIYGALIVFLLGFSPQLLGYGYYGTKTLKIYINKETVTAYREVLYAPDLVPPQNSTVAVPAPSVPITAIPTPCPTSPETPSGPVAIIPPSNPNNPSNPSETCLPVPKTPIAEIPLIAEHPIEIDTGFNIFGKPFDPFLKSLSFDNFQKIFFSQNKKEITPFFDICKKPLGAPFPKKEQPLIQPGHGSSFVVRAGFDSPIKFIKNYFGSFICSLLGPFPWQIRYQRQLLFLIETIPWYFLFFILVSGIVGSIRKEGILKTLKAYRFVTPLLLFSIMSLAAISLFINNFGIITRIRIPSFIILLCLIPLSFSGFNLNNKYLNNIEKYFSKLYKKIFSYWWRSPLY